MAKRSAIDQRWNFPRSPFCEKKLHSTYTGVYREYPKQLSLLDIFRGKVNIHPSYCWNFYPPPTFSRSREGEGGVAAPVSLEALNRTWSVAFLAFWSFFVESCDEVLGETAQFFINYFSCRFLLGKKDVTFDTRKFFTRYRENLHVSVLDDGWSSSKMKNTCSTEDLRLRWMIE